MDPYIANHLMYLRRMYVMRYRREPLYLRLTKHTLDGILHSTAQDVRMYDIDGTRTSIFGLEWYIDPNAKCDSVNRSKRGIRAYASTKRKQPNVFAQLFGQGCDR